MQAEKGEPPQTQADNNVLVMAQTNTLQGEATSGSQV